MSNTTFKSVSGGIIVKHPTNDYSVEVKFTEDAIVLIATYSNGIIIERHDYKDLSKPTTINSPNARFVQISENEFEAVLD